jgi:hypothetical protein
VKQQKNHVGTSCLQAEWNKCTLKTDSSFSRNVQSRVISSFLVFVFAFALLPFLAHFICFLIYFHFFCSLFLVFPYCPTVYSSICNPVLQAINRTAVCLSVMCTLSASCFSAVPSAVAGIFNGHILEIFSSPLNKYYETRYVIVIQLLLTFSVGIITFSFNAQWLLYVPPVLILRILTLCPQNEVYKFCTFWHGYV